MAGFDSTTPGAPGGNSRPRREQALAPGGWRTMSQTDFDPPLHVGGPAPALIRTLYEAERYVHSQGTGHHHNTAGLLRRLQSASTRQQRLDAANAFRAWADAEGLLTPQAGAP